MLYPCLAIGVLADGEVGVVIDVLPKFLVRASDVAAALTGPLENLLAVLISGASIDVDMLTDENSGLGDVMALKPTAP